MNKTVLITGTSSGFGKLAVKKFQAEGWNVIATMRTPEKEQALSQLENLLLLKLDVTDKRSITKAVSDGISHFGKIDVLVNNAGFGLQGIFEYTTDAQMRRQFDVNVFGLVSTTQALLPHFRANECGVIVNVASIAGRVAFPFTTFYHASKFAVEGLTESLQYELMPFGIRVKLIEPGAFDTKINSNSVWAIGESGNPYLNKLDVAKTTMQGMAAASKQDPEEVSDAIFTAATDDSDILRYPVGGDAFQIFESRVKMSDTEFKNMMKMNLGI
ncbi:short-chain dehydrogenase/reductase [Thalassotalea loyana]|uniref:Short-chain dehydrogenase/reductase n=1 Tax=Thalassotalea loyana TaxID=280483 RepID=A0ABQ6HHZ4_9GAMM|nr:SDR family oxidoreductase [Thalassotalea loyana]GLX87324.1 short-chain dehydrogenase/reductase [Thalassotalea loyana]